MRQIPDGVPVDEDGCTPVQRAYEATVTEDGLPSVFVDRYADQHSALGFPFDMFSFSQWFAYSYTRQMPFPHDVETAAANSFMSGLMAGIRYERDRQEGK